MKKIFCFKILSVFRGGIFEFFLNNSSLSRRILYKYVHIVRIFKRLVAKDFFCNCFNLTKKIKFMISSCPLCLRTHTVTDPILTL